MNILPSSPQGVCPSCGGRLIGDSFSIVTHCEHLNDIPDVEPDADPVYCSIGKPSMNVKSEINRIELLTRELAALMEEAEESDNLDLEYHVSDALGSATDLLYQLKKIEKVKNEC